MNNNGYSIRFITTDPVVYNDDYTYFFPTHEAAVRMADILSHNITTYGGRAVYSGRARHVCIGAIPIRRESR